MTRINTNVSSLSAQKSLARSNMNLQEALTRLSTGLRINTGKDDPAGLIASEVLRSDIISVERAVINSERANQMIATADSSLGQVSGLLNDIRGLVSDAANTGALSEQQIAANQLQIDSSLEAIDRIAQVTTFQGKRLLDGNLDFITEGVSSNIQSLQVDQANFGTQTEIGVTVDVVAQAERAQLQYSSNTTAADVVIEVGGSSGFEAFSFAAGSTIDEMAAAINLVSDALGVQAAVTYNTATADGAGSTVLTTVGSSDNITVTADTAGADAGDIALQYSLDMSGAVTSAAWTVATATTPAEINVKLEATKWDDAVVAGVDIGNGGIFGIKALVNGDQFNAMTMKLTIGGADTVDYDYETNVLTVDAAGGPAASAIVTLVNNAVGNLLLASAPTNPASLAVSGTYVVSSTDGLDGGTIIADVQNVYDAINAGTVGTNVTATGTAASTSGDLATLFTRYAMYGNENTGATTEPDNRIQILGPDGVAEMDIEFVKGDVNETLGISFTENRITDGYSTAIIQGAAADTSLQITAKNRGTEYDGVTVDLIHHGTRTDVLWDPENAKITIYNDFSGGVLASAVETQVNNALDGDGTANSGLFTASIPGGAGGIAMVAGTDVGTFSGGDQYTKATINLATDASGAITTTAAEMATYMNASLAMQGLGVTVSHVGTSDGSGLVAPGSTTFGASGVTTSNAFASGTTYSRAGTAARMTITATTAGATFDDIQVIFRDDPAIAAATADERISYDSEAKELNVYINSSTSTLQDVLDNYTASNNPTEYYQFNIVAVGDATGKLYSTDSGQLTGGVASTGTSNGVDFSGNYDEGDVIGTTGLTFQSTNYGSGQFISVKALAGTFQTTDTDGQAKDRDVGADVNLRLNGIQAISDGLDGSMNTSVLDLKFTLASTVTAGTEMNFQITGGGAQFQLGPDVVSNQQARLGIQSVNTAKVGGTAGRLYELRSGGAKALDTDVSGAAAVVDQVITQVTMLRGRLGAFQKTTLETNIAALSDTLENLTAAESSIRDADFAKESAALTRAQILVQSGISVLSIANSNPQNVLALLR